VLREGAALSRATATLLERSAAMHHRLIQVLSLSSTAEAAHERGLLLSEQSALMQQAAHHRKTAAESDMAAGIEEDGEFVREPLVEPSADGDATLGTSLLRAAVFGAAVALPAGVTLGVGAISAAPYLGIDPDGSARAPVRATLKRDSAGRFLFQVQKGDGGEIFISSLLESDAADERSRLVVGDRLRSVDGRLVLSAEQRQEKRRQQQTLIEGLSDEGPASLDVDEVKQLVRAAGESVLVEVWREDIRPVVDRLQETRTMLENDVARVAHLAKPVLDSSQLAAVRQTAQPLIDKASVFAQPLIDRASQLQQQAQPHLERLVSNVQLPQLQPPQHAAPSRQAAPTQQGLYAPFGGERDPALAAPISSIAPPIMTSTVSGSHAPTDRSRNGAVAPPGMAGAELEAVHREKDLLMEKMQAAVDEDDFEEATRLQDIVDDLDRKMLYAQHSAREVTHLDRSDRTSFLDR
jgi:hypothetical protein